MKKLLKALSGLLVVAAIAVVIVFFQLNSLVKMAIEKYGSEIAGVSVSIGTVSISPTSGEGSISSFSMGNPSGFKAKKSFKSDEMSIMVDKSSLNTHVITVQDVTINSPDIYYEAVRGTNNFKQIQENIKKNLADRLSKESSGMLDDKQIIINDFYIKHGSVLVTAPQLGNQSYKVLLSDIHLHHLGKDDKPGNLPKIMERIMMVITNQVINDVGVVTLENFSKKLLQGAVQSPMNDVQKTVEGIVPGIENIIPH